MCISIVDESNPKINKLDKPRLTMNLYIPPPKFDIAPEK